MSGPSSPPVGRSDADHDCLWRRLAVALVGVEALVPAGAAVYALVQIVSGQSVVARNEAMLTAMLLLAAAGLVVVALGIHRGRRSVRMPCLVWQALLLLGLVPAMLQAQRQLLAVLVTAFVLLTGYATVRATNT